MYHPSTAAWVALVTVVLALLVVVTWAVTTRRRRPEPSGLTVRLLDDYGAVPPDHTVAITFLNLRLTNNSDRPEVVDGLGYRRVGQRRLVPIRRFDAPHEPRLDDMVDTLLPPPYRLAPGESLDITLYAPALCPAPELAGLYVHTREGELVWLPEEDLAQLTRACRWSA